jgi:hypothetical protein
MNDFRVEGKTLFVEEFLFFLFYPEDIQLLFPALSVPESASKRSNDSNGSDCIKQSGPPPPPQGVQNLYFQNLLVCVTGVIAFNGMVEEPVAAG